MTTVKLANFWTALVLIVMGAQAALTNSNAGIAALPEMSDKDIQYVTIPGEIGKLTKAQRAFVVEFAATNSSTDLATRIQVIDPSARPCIEAHPEFFLELFKLSSRVFPREFKVGFLKIEKPEGPRRKMKAMNYSLPPTHVMVIEWGEHNPANTRAQTRMRGVTLIRDIRENESGFHELVMCPNAEMLKAFMDKMKRSGR